MWYNQDYAQNHFEMNGVILMSTLNPHDFDKKMNSTMEADMVQSIWNTLDQTTNFTPSFRQQVNSFHPLNFYNLKDLVDEEVKRMDYVPNSLNFDDKFGIVQSSQAMLSEKPASQGRISGYNNNINHNNRGDTYNGNNYNSGNANNNNNFNGNNNNGNNYNNGNANNNNSNGNNFNGNTRTSITYK